MGFSLVINDYFLKIKYIHIVALYMPIYFGHYGAGFI